MYSGHSFTHRDETGVIVMQEFVTITIGRYSIKVECHITTTKFLREKVK
jgi:hypothetical protein